jgi:cardiolipin synthase
MAPFRQEKPGFSEKPGFWWGWLVTWWQTVNDYWQEITAWGAVLNGVLSVVTIAWILTSKKEATSAVAWCLVVFFLPFIGTLLFLVFGYQHVQRPLLRKRRHKTHYQSRQGGEPLEAAAGGASATEPEGRWAALAHLADRFGAFPVTDGNRVTFYHEGQHAYDGMLEAIRSARHHIHMEVFIFQPDATGHQFLEALARKAREGVQVRLLYDAMGSRRLHRRTVRGLRAAGGKCAAFLPLNPLRRRIQVNLRNHRKILVVDGRVAFTGGLNVGDEYLGRNPRRGFWRDTHMRVEGPAVTGLQRVFLEDWDFAAGEHLHGPEYFPPHHSAGSCRVQVIHSGPDQPLKSIREIYFAAILQARRRVWIMSPYFVPDAGLHDAICLAGYLGLDVRMLCQFHPDKWIPFFAARYYWGDVLDAGVKVYQYTKGMMHAKVMIVDGEWASVGTANLDNRSMHLNFEVNSLLYSGDEVTALERTFLDDIKTAILLDPRVFARRPFASRLIENACRLLSPVL